MISLATLVRDQQGRCYYCQRSFMRHGPLRATRDHYQPQWAGGTSEPDNIVAACAQCNGRKGPLRPEDFLALKDKPQELRRAYAIAMAQAKGQGRMPEGAQVAPSFTPDPDETGIRRSASRRSTGSSIPDL